jgi:hypothetical protein
VLYLVVGFFVLAATLAFGTKRALVDELLRLTITGDILGFPAIFWRLVRTLGSSLFGGGLPADLPVELDDPLSFMFEGVDDWLSLSLSSVSTVLGGMVTMMYAASSTVIGF